MNNCTCVSPRQRLYRAQSPLSIDSLSPFGWHLLPKHLGQQICQQQAALLQSSDTRVQRSQDTREARKPLRIVVSACTSTYSHAFVRSASNPRSTIHLSVQAHRSCNKNNVHAQPTTMATRFRSSFRLVSRQASLRAQTLHRTVTLGARAYLSTSSPAHLAAAPHGEVEFTADKFPHMKRNNAFKKVRIQGV